MIDSSVTLIPLDSIDASARQREIKKDHAIELAADIAMRDLIHCPVVDAETKRLIVGGHRLEAFRINRDNNVPCEFADYQDWTLIPVRLASNVTPQELEMMELIENLKRLDLSWQDEVMAIHKIHQMFCEKNSDWSGNATAKALNISGGRISRCLMVATELLAGNPKVLAASSIFNAYGVLERSLSRALADEINVASSAIGATLGDVFNSEKSQAPTTEQAPSTKTSEVSIPHAPAILPADQSILQADFIQWASEYTGPKFNFGHFDFPYGINYDQAKQGNVQTMATYADTPELFWQLTRTLVDQIPRLFSPSFHIMFWYSQEYDIELRAFLAENLPANCVVQSFPMIWHKTDNKGLLPDPNRYGRRTYEVCLLITGADRKIVKPVALSYGGPTSREIHLSEKPVPMLRHFFQMFVDESTRMLDGTCGSGNSLQAAESLGASSVLGLELDPENVTNARRALTEFRLKASMARGA